MLVTKHIRALPGMEDASEEELAAALAQMYAAAEIVVDLALRTQQRNREKSCHSMQLSIVESPQ